MFDVLLSLKLTHGLIFRGMEVLGVLGFLALLISRRWKRWLPIAGAALVTGVLVGYAVSWLLSDVFDVFGVSLSPDSRAWFSAAIGAIGVAIARLVWSKGHRLAPIASIVLFALVAALGINADLGMYPDLRTAFSISAYHDIRLPPFDTSAATVTPLSSWKPQAALPRGGRIGLVTIPATTSGFHPRSALVYLPPAALVVGAPRLPVLEMMSGQPGGPEQMFTSGGLGASLDAFAKAHNGLAPIVVVPDQLGAPNRNPMCVDSELGNAATYVTIDVPAWIRSHLNVLADRADWAVGGFSQGGTCAIQLGAGMPSLFGNIVDISGEIAPRKGGLQQTIDSGFQGSKARYLAATPRHLMHTHGPYPDTLALIAMGELDSRFGPEAREIAGYASAAGMKVHLLVSPGSAHDWRTVHFAVEKSLPLLGTRWGFIG